MSVFKTLWQIRECAVGGENQPRVYFFPDKKKKNNSDAEGRSKRMKLEKDCILHRGIIKDVKQAYEEKLQDFVGSANDFNLFLKAKAGSSVRSAVQNLDGITPQIAEEITRDLNRWIGAYIDRMTMSLEHTTSANEKASNVATASAMIAKKTQSQPHRGKKTFGQDVEVETVERGGNPRVTRGRKLPSDKATINNEASHAKDSDAEDQLDELPKAVISPRAEDEADCDEAREVRSDEEQGESLFANASTFGRRGTRSGGRKGVRQDPSTHVNVSVQGKAKRGRPRKQQEGERTMPTQRTTFKWAKMRRSSITIAAKSASHTEAPAELAPLVLNYPGTSSTGEEDQALLDKFQEVLTETTEAVSPNELKLLLHRIETIQILRGLLDTMNNHHEDPKALCLCLKTSLRVAARHLGPTEYESLVARTKLREDLSKLALILEARIESEYWTAALQKDRGLEVNIRE